ncbi:MAG: hypothetical protein WCO99_06555 [Planctomycetota bacterium]
MQVRLKDIRLERLRDFGDVWLAWGLWRMLGLDGLLATLLPEGREDVPWGTVAAILTIARRSASGWWSQRKDSHEERRRVSGT